MIESTVKASNTIGLIGSLSPAHKRRGEVDAGAVTDIQERVEARRAVSNAVKAGSMIESMSDAELVALVLGGNQDMFALLIERYKDAVQNLAYRMLNNVTEAEDITQETFVRAYTQLVTYKPTHKFSTWLLSIASHLAIDQLRRRRFLALPLEDVPFLEWIVDIGTGPEQSALQGEQQDEIQSYLQRLPSKYRAVIVLRYWYDFSYEEIANTLHLTPALVKARLHRARELLARYMQQKPAKEKRLDAVPGR